jgi:hypothetical protein
MHVALRRLVELSRSSEDPEVLVTAALFAPDADALLARANAAASTSRERQLVAIATAHLRGDQELVDALARDHLADHPGDVLVACIAAAIKEET